MPKFDANLSMMFPELEMPQRFAAARDAGFSAIELLRPYEHDVADLRGWIEDAGLELVGHPASHVAKLRAHHHVGPLEGRIEIGATVSGRRHRSKFGSRETAAFCPGIIANWLAAPTVFRGLYR